MPISDSDKQNGQFYVIETFPYPQFITDTDGEPLIFEDYDKRCQRQKTASKDTYYSLAKEVPLPGASFLCRRNKGKEAKENALLGNLLNA